MDRPIWGQAGVGRPPQGQRGRCCCGCRLLWPELGLAEAAEGRVFRRKDAFRESQVALHHPVGAETREQDPIGPNTRGFQAHEVLVHLALRGAPHLPHHVRPVARPVRDPEPGQRAFRAQGLGEPPSPAGPLGLVKVAGHDLDTGPHSAQKSGGVADDDGPAPVRCQGRREMHVEGGRGYRGGREGVQEGGVAGMNHIDQELQKCTTLTYSAYTFVIMSEHRYSNHLFGSVQKKVWNMLSVPHFMPLAFSSQSIYLGSELEAKIEDRVYNVVAFCMVGLGC